MSSNSSVDIHTGRFNALSAPLIVYGILSAYVCATFMMKSEWTWFSWHPFCMIIGFVVLAGNAILLKKIGGYTNTKYHGIIMCMCTAITCFAWYVIYVSKEMKHKEHLTTYHGQLGAAVMIANLGLSVFGLAGLHPDFGILRTNKLVRFMHKWTGRVIVGLSWVVCVLGFVRMSDDNMLYNAAYTIPLIIFGGYFLL